jgi:hypothetical protein
MVQILKTSWRISKKQNPKMITMTTVAMAMGSMKSTVFFLLPLNGKYMSLFGLMS